MCLALPSANHELQRRRRSAKTTCQHDGVTIPIGHMVPQPYPLVCFRALGQNPFKQSRWLVLGWTQDGRPVVVPDASGPKSYVPTDRGLQVLDGVLHYRLPDFDVTANVQVEVGREVEVRVLG